MPITELQELQDFEVLFVDGQKTTVTAEYYVHKRDWYLFYVGSFLVRRIEAIRVESVR